MVHLTRLLVLFRKPLRIVEISLKIPSIYPKKSSFSFEENYTSKMLMYANAKDVAGSSGSSRPHRRVASLFVQVCPKK